MPFFSLDMMMMMMMSTTMTVNFVACPTFY